jgi:hypothetical protein
MGPGNKLPGYDHLVPAGQENPHVSIRGPTDERELVPTGLPKSRLDNREIIIQMRRTTKLLNVI